MTWTQIKTDRMEAFNVTFEEIKEKDGESIYTPRKRKKCLNTAVVSPDDPTNTNSNEENISQKSTIVFKT